jgi:HEAT repeat protein
LAAAACAAVAAETATQLQTAVSGTGQARYVAIDDLGESHVDASNVVPQLQRLLAEKDTQVRWRSARALGDYGELAKNTAPDLRKLLTDADPVVQYHAAVALGKVGDKSDETTRALVKLATSKDARVARAAIAALRNLKPGPQRVMEAFKAQLESDDDAVVVHALNAIVEQGAAAVPLLNEALSDPKTAMLAVAAIEQIGPPAAETVPALTKVLRATKHSQLLIHTCLALASIGPAAEAASPELVSLLEHDTHATVPVAAAYALGAIGAKNADAALKQAAAKDNPMLRMVAAWALAKIHPDDEAAMKAAVEKLAQGLASSDAHMGAMAAKGLQMLDPPAEILAPPLMALAEDPDPAVSQQVVTALASLGERVVPRASIALQNPERRGFAVRVITAVGPKAAGAVEPLIDAMQDADAEFRSQIHFALAAIGPAAAPATDALADAIASEDQRVRESALYALRQIGSGAKSAVDELLEKAKAAETFDSKAAAWALARIEPSAEVASAVTPALISGLNDADEQTRVESAEALGEFGPANQAAVAPLKEAAADDGSPAVREAATAALKKIGA